MVRALLPLLAAITLSACMTGPTPRSAEVASRADAGEGPRPISCPAGTCVMQPGGACEAPTGQLGNACCGCGADGRCSSRCRCLAAGTRIVTHRGEVPVEALRADDLVLSMVLAKPSLVRLSGLSSCPVSAHSVIRVRLSNGRTLEASAEHPLAGGRLLGAVRPGEELGGVRALTVEEVPYDGDRTYDLLPESTSAVYVAEGAWLSSTLTGSSRHGGVDAGDGCEQPPASTAGVSGGR